MTQDEPERETVEEAQPVCVYCDRILACDRCGKEQPYDDLSVLKAKLSTALVISNNYQSLMVTAQRERDEARAGYDAARGEYVNLWKGPCGHVWAKNNDDGCPFCANIKYAAERDEARSSLSRMWEALKPFAELADARRGSAPP